MQSLHLLPLLVALNYFSSTSARFAASPEFLQLLGNSIQKEGADSQSSGKDESNGRQVRVMPPDTLSRDQREQGSECCALGQVAGDKGFHCNARFYARDVRERNRNRAHGRKMSFYGRDRIDGYGEHEMRRFEECTGSRYVANSFRRCCLDANRGRRTEKHVDTSIYHLI